MHLAYESTMLNIIHVSHYDMSSSLKTLVTRPSIHTFVPED